jgi:5-formyltetrahydrofolate cyclo-ligase
VSPIADEKRRLRKELRRRRVQADSNELAARDMQIVERLDALCGSQRHVALFWPMSERREVDLRLLDARLRARGAALYYPWMPNTGEDAPATFRRVVDPKDFVTHPLGFGQPRPDAELAGKLDMVVVPALAATRTGHRLGYGAGTYDRLLPIQEPLDTVVVVRATELVDTLPVEAHDCALRWVVTDQETVGPLR